MKRVQGMSGAALTLLLGLAGTGCAPKEEAPSVGPAAPAVSRGGPDSASGAKIETVTLKAVGMT